MLKNSAKISDVTKRDIFHLNLTLKKETIGQNCSRLDFTRAWDQSAY